MRRIGHILSVALITAGLVVLADVGLTLAYKEPISSIYGSIKQSEAARQLDDLEASYPTPADRRAVAAVERPARRVQVLARRFGRQVEEGAAIGRILAHDMAGLDVVFVEGTDQASLEKGPGHYPDTPMPRAPGTVGIAGHRTTYLAPFRHIDSLRAGDPIVLKMPYATVRYRVEKTAIVDPSDVWVVRDVGYKRLVLSACHPVYSAAERYIVFARQVSARPTVETAG